MRAKRQSTVHDVGTLCGSECSAPGGRNSFKIPHQAHPLNIREVATETQRDHCKRAKWSCGCEPEGLNTNALAEFLVALQCAASVVLDGAATSIVSAAPSPILLRLPTNRRRALASPQARLCTIAHRCNARSVRQHELEGGSAATGSACASRRR
jgi:hypothetical protein